MQAGRNQGELRVETSGVEKLSLFFFFSFGGKDYYQTFLIQKSSDFTIP